MLFLQFSRNRIFAKQKEMNNKEREKEEEIKKLLAIKVFWDGKNDPGFIEHFPQYTYAIDYDNNALLVMKDGQLMTTLTYGWGMKWCECRGYTVYPDHVNFIDPEVEEDDES